MPDKYKKKLTKEDKKMAIAKAKAKAKAKTIPTLQEVAELLRNAVYSDEQTNEIVWSLRVLHPKTNEGVVGFSGGIWHRADPRNKKNKGRRNTSISFAFEEKKRNHALSPMAG